MTHDNQVFIKPLDILYNLILIKRARPFFVVPLAVCVIVIANGCYDGIILTNRLRHFKAYHTKPYTGIVLKRYGCLGKIKRKYWLKSEYDGILQVFGLMFIKIHILEIVMK